MKIDKTLSEESKPLARDFTEDKEAHDNYVKDWDGIDAMDLAQTYDDVSRETKNGLTDSATAILYLERSARVAGQLPEGETQALGKKDRGKGVFMDILRTNWIYPNANAQNELETKLYLWVYNSRKYPMPMYYDLNTSPSGYFGPDCWLQNPRNFIPQNGLVNVEEMDYCHNIAYKSPRYFEDLLEAEKKKEKSDWDIETLEELIEPIKNYSRGVDPQRDTKQNQDKQGTDRRLIAIATRYESGPEGRWVTFLPDFSFRIIRNIENPHKNSRIPFVVLSSPSYDNYYGTSDFQRSQPMQMANDGITNFSFQFLKKNLAPRMAVNAQTIIPHTMQGKPGEVVEFNGPPEWKSEDVNAAGLTHFQAMKGMILGAIQSIGGTTDTRQNAESSMDPGMGKTPEALRMIQSRESTRDNQDRKFYEAAVRKLIDGWMSIIPTISQKIPVDMLEQDIMEIAEVHEDVLDLFKTPKEGDKRLKKNPDSPLIKSGMVGFTEAESGKQVQFRIDPDKLKGMEYRFQIRQNSTAKKTKEEQLSSLLDMVKFLGQMPNELQGYRESTGKTMDMQVIIDAFQALGDVPNLEKLFVQVEQPGEQQQQQAEQEQQPQDPNQVPMTPQSISALANAPAPEQTAQPQSEADLIEDPELRAQAKQYEAQIQ